MNFLHLRAAGGDVYRNLAIEEFLLERARGFDVTLFTWHSDGAVVIGRHQNPWNEADPRFLARHGIALARRVSGGGAVYQDRGNLNFSFIAGRGIFDIDRQAGIVREGLARLGISADIGPRKAMLVSGKKFSGSAFALRKGGALHHGTVLVDTDLRMMRALRGRMHITSLRGTLSEAADVVNLSSIVPGITAGAVADALLAACEAHFAQRFSRAGEAEILDEDALAGLVARQRSWGWRYGSTPAFETEIGRGDRRYALTVDRGLVGRIRTLPEGKILLDAGGALHFRRDAVRMAIEGAERRRVPRVMEDFA
ncbi:MAG: hypothetical protein EPN93_05470 [Spirochaetes bacterium]|nr:MAG: hypothetical protein EPN93_05470 [Spirochaetota bacterium]